MLDTIKTPTLDPVMGGHALVEGYPFHAFVRGNPVKLFATIDPRRLTFVSVMHHASGAFISSGWGSKAVTGRGVIAAARREIRRFNDLDGCVWLKREIIRLNALPVLNP